jgi:hypothetical protein
MHGTATSQKDEGAGGWNGNTSARDDGDTHNDAEPPRAPALEGFAAPGGLSNARFANQLIRSRLNDLEGIEQRLEQVTTQSYELIAAIEEVSSMLREEKHATLELAAEVNCESSHKQEYVFSFAFMLRKVCSALTKN